MSVEEESRILAPFLERAEKGEIVEVREIAAAYQATVNHHVSNGQIYCVLHRHGWRKVMPRSKHPKKASEEAIEASKNYIILLCCDGAAWHKSSMLKLPKNIILFHIPPYTPEMNPIEQIWKEIRKRGFHNEVFATLEKVVDRLCHTICSLTNAIISSITCRHWIIESFN